MSVEVRLRRGTANQHSSFTGALGEVTVDTSTNTLRVHDGVTAGGHILAKLDDIVGANFLSISSDVIPAANNTYSLGSPDKVWKNLYLSGNTIYLGGNKISKTNNGSIKFTDALNNVISIQASSITTATNTPSTFGNTTITNLILQNVLGTKYGGTGLDSFTAGGVLYASNTTHLSFATGSSGAILQLNANGMPSFDKLDGGSYS